MNKYIKEILLKQCKIVKADYNKIDFKKEDWYWDYRWTEQQELEFKLWLIDYIKTNKEARNELMTIPSNNKHFLNKFADQFSLNYGWKTKK